MAMILPSYEGEKSMDVKRLRQGRGVYKFQYQGFTYDGEWVAGVKQGRGQMTLPDGSSYNGEFLEGEMTGVGTRRWPNGQIYEGELFRGERHGYGTLVEADGAMYTGDWQEQRRHGIGKYTASRGAYTYEGGWSRHHFEGCGKYSTPDGATFDGTFLAGQRHGAGVDIGSDGSRYTGGWQEGVRHGYGEYAGSDLSPSGFALQYAGPWERGTAVEASDRFQLVDSEVLEATALAHLTPEQAAAAEKAKEALLAQMNAAKEEGADPEAPPDSSKAPLMVVAVVAGSELPRLALLCKFREPPPETNASIDVVEAPSDDVDAAAADVAAAAAAEREAALCRPSYRESGRTFELTLRSDEVASDDAAAAEAATEDTATGTVAPLPAAEPVPLIVEQGTIAGAAYGLLPRPLPSLVLAAQQQCGPELAPALQHFRAPYSERYPTLSSDNGLLCRFQMPPAPDLEAFQEHTRSAANLEALVKSANDQAAKAAAMEPLENGNAPAGKGGGAAAAKGKGKAAGGKAAPGGKGATAAAESPVGGLRRKLLGGKLKMAAKAVKAAVAESKPLKLRLSPGLAEQRSQSAKNEEEVNNADAASIAGGTGSGTSDTASMFSGNVVDGCPCLPVPAFPGAWAQTGLLLGPSVRGFTGAVKALRSAAGAVEARAKKKAERAALAATPGGAAKLGGAFSCSLDFYLNPPPPVEDPDIAAQAAAAAAAEEEAAKQALVEADSAQEGGVAASGGSISSDVSGRPMSRMTAAERAEKAAAAKKLEAARAAYPYPPTPPQCDVVLFEGAFVTVRLECGSSRKSDVARMEKDADNNFEGFDGNQLNEPLSAISQKSNAQVWRPSATPGSPKGQKPVAGSGAVAVSALTAANNNTTNNSSNSSNSIDSGGGDMNGIATSQSVDLGNSPSVRSRIVVTMKSQRKAPLSPQEQPTMTAVALESNTGNNSLNENEGSQGTDGEDNAVSEVVCEFDAAPLFKAYDPRHFPGAPKIDLAAAASGSEGGGGSIISSASLKSAGKAGKGGAAEDAAAAAAAAASGLGEDEVKPKKKREPVPQESSPVLLAGGVVGPVFGAWHSLVLRIDPNYYDDAAGSNPQMSPPPQAQQEDEKAKEKTKEGTSADSSEDVATATAAFENTAANNLETEPVSSESPVPSTLAVSILLDGLCLRPIVPKAARVARAAALADLRAEEAAIEKAEKDAVEQVEKELARELRRQAKAAAMADDGGGGNKSGNDGNLQTVNSPTSPTFGRTKKKKRVKAEESEEEIAARAEAKAARAAAAAAAVPVFEAAARNWALVGVDIDNSFSDVNNSNSSNSNNSNNSKPSPRKKESFAFGLAAAGGLELFATSPEAASAASANATAFGEATAAVLEADALLVARAAAASNAESEEADSAAAVTTPANDDAAAASNIDAAAAASEAATAKVAALNDNRGDGNGNGGLVLLAGAPYGGGIGSVLLFDRVLAHAEAVQACGAYSAWRALQWAAQDAWRLRANAVLLAWHLAHPPPPPEVLEAAAQAKLERQRNRAELRKVARLERIANAAATDASASKESAPSGKGKGKDVGSAKGEPGASQDNADDEGDEGYPSTAEEEEDEGEVDIDLPQLPSPLPVGCVLAQARPLPTLRGGATFRGVRIPLDTPPGIYTLTLRDASFDKAPDADATALMAGAKNGNSGLDSSPNTNPEAEPDVGSELVSRPVKQQQQKALEPGSTSSSMPPAAAAEASSTCGTLLAALLPQTLKVVVLPAPEE